MQTFETQLNPSEWTEILQGKEMLVFDIVSATTVEVYFSETSIAPKLSLKGNKVASWGKDWDFTARLLTPGVQRIWARGTTAIRGVRE
jgi:hypothetical protein